MYQQGKNEVYYLIFSSVQIYTQNFTANMIYTL